MSGTRRSDRPRPLRADSPIVGMHVAVPPTRLLPGMSTVELRRQVRPVRWTRSARTAIAGYVRHMADLLCLRDWEIVIDWTPTSDDSCAEIQPIFGQKRATLSFGPTFLALASTDQRQTVAHELLHCHLFAVTEQSRVSFAAVSGDEAVVRLAQAGVEHSTEIAVDGIADAFAPLLPLPPWAS